MAYPGGGGMYFSYKVDEVDARGEFVDFKKDGRCLAWQKAGYFAVYVSVNNKSKPFTTSKSLGDTLEDGQIFAAGTKLFKVRSGFKEKAVGGAGSGGGGGGAAGGGGGGMPYSSGPQRE